MSDAVLELGRRARAASRELAKAGTEAKDAALLAAADLLVEHSAEIVAANVGDLEAAAADGMEPGPLDRLRLDAARIEAMADGLRNVAGLADPVGEIVKGWVRPNGLEIQQVRVTALSPINLISDDEPHREIAVNIVVAIQAHANGAPILDKKGKDISRSDYITSLAPGLQRGAKIRGYYRRRWGIENQGFRSLSQTWDIDRPAGHSYGAVLARLVFVFMIYNARHLFEKESRHRADYAEELRQMRAYGPGIALVGASIVALTLSGFCCALKAVELLKLHKQRLLNLMRRGIAAGKSVEEVMREIDSN